MTTIGKGINGDDLKSDFKEEYYSEDGIVDKEGVTHQQDNSF